MELNAPAHGDFAVTHQTAFLIDGGRVGLDDVFAERSNRAVVSLNRPETIKVDVWTILPSGLLKNQQQSVKGETDPSLIESAVVFLRDHYKMVLVAR